MYSNSYNPIIDPVIEGVGNEGTRYAEGVSISGMGGDGGDGVGIDRKSVV